jgi:hypothetical protein
MADEGRVRPMAGRFIDVSVGAAVTGEAERRVVSAADRPQRGWAWHTASEGLPPGALAERDDRDASRAVQRYVQLRTAHRWAATNANFVYWLLQLGSIGLATTTPLLIFFSKYPDAVKAVPAAVAAALVGLTASATGAACRTRGGRPRLQWIGSTCTSTGGSGDI